MLDLKSVTVNVITYVSDEGSGQCVGDTEAEDILLKHGIRDQLIKQIPACAELPIGDSFIIKVPENARYILVTAQQANLGVPDRNLEEKQCPGCRGLKRISGVDCALCEGAGTVWVEVPV